MSKQQKPIVSKPREASVEQYLRRQCLTRGWDCWKLDPENNRGVQDRLVLPGGGKAYFVELKRQEGKPTKLQVNRCKRMIQRGYDAHILYSKEDVDIFINRVHRGICS